jgi:ATP-dependent protease ClpP protease subunit
MNNSQKNENTEDNGSIITKKDGIAIETITVIGQVEGHYFLPENQKATKYEHLIPLIVEAEQSEETKGVLVILNTVGGDVEAGLAIAEMIAGMTKPTVSLVLGGGHSIGVPLAVATRYSLIVPTATMTLHPVRVNGLVIGVPQSFENLSRMQDRIVSFICKNSSVAEDDLRTLMTKTDEMTTDVGSIISGEEAVTLGLIDGVGGIGDAISVMNKMLRVARGNI